MCCMYLMAHHVLCVFNGPPCVVYFRDLFNAAFVSCVFKVLMTHHVLYVFNGPPCAVYFRDLFNAAFVSCVFNGPPCAVCI